MGQCIKNKNSIVKSVLSWLRILAKEIYIINNCADTQFAVKTAQNFVLRTVISQILKTNNINDYYIIKEIDEQIQLDIPKSLSDKIQSDIEKFANSITPDTLNDIYEKWQDYKLLLNIQSGDFEIKQGKNERRYKGIYYTPKFIVKYIVDNTLGKYLWGNCNQSYGNGKTPDEIKDLTILDPACGCGLFLSYVFDVLAEYYSYYLPDKADLWLPLILEKHIYGMDLDDNAINIARIILMLKALIIFNLKISPAHINHGNFLAFDNKKILGNDSFFLIIGNPPHGAKIPVEEKEYIRSNFETYESRDSSAFFIENSVNLLKENGILGFIVPKTLSYVVSWQSIRKFLIDHCRIMEVVDIKNAFDNVRLEQLIILAQKKLDKSIYDYQVCVKHYSSENVASNTIESNDLSPWHFSIMLADKKARALRDKILGNSIFLSEIAEIWDGLNIRKFSSFSYESNFEYNQPCLMGKNIKKYGIKQNFRYIKDTEGFNQKITNLFYRPKIIAQDIVAYVKYPKPHIKIMATMDKLGKFLSFNTVTNIHSYQYPMEYLCAIINSRLISWYAYNYIYNRAIRTMHFRAGYADHIPIYKLDLSEPRIKSTSELIIDLVYKLIYLNEQMNANKNIIMETEKELDELIFKLYDINTEELKYLQYYVELY